MVDNLTVIHLIIAEIFIPQYFTIRAAPGFMGPANRCGLEIEWARQKDTLLFHFPVSFGILAPQ